MCVVYHGVLFAWFAPSGILALPGTLSMLVSRYPYWNPMIVSHCGIATPLAYYSLHNMLVNVAWFAVGLSGSSSQARHSIQYPLTNSLQVHDRHNQGQVHMSQWRDAAANQLRRW